MASRDVRLELDPQASLVPDQYTGTANGTGIDLQGAEAALISITTGAFGGTTPTGSYKVQESDLLGSGYTDVADTDLIGATGNTSGVALAASTNVKVSYIGAKRFVRVIVSAVGGSTPIIRAGATVIRAHLRQAGGNPA